MRRIKASSLNYTILLFVLFISVISTILLSNHYFKVRSQLRISHLETINNCQSGLNYLLALKSNTSDLHFDTLISIGEKNDSLKLEATNWGLFRIVKSIAFNKNFKIKRAAISGNNLQNNDRSVLYVADHSQSLSLSQKTMINGKIEVPRAGLKYELLNGINFTGTYVPEANILMSNDSLPFVSSELINLTFDSLQNLLVSRQKLIDVSQHSDSLISSFWDETTILYIESNVIEYQSISGKVVIIADSILTIPSDCKLEDVILFGKNIKIGDNVKGTFQCFAKNEIEVGRNVELKFPSALVLLTSDTVVYSADYKPAEINIKEGTTMEGLIYSSYPYSPDFKNQVFLNISSGSKITGSVYWQGKIQLCGSVFGQLYTDSFIYKTPLGTYRNFIVNGSIDQIRKGEDMILPGLFTTTNHGEIAKWLY